ncbi:MAG: ATP/GTP-binding protein [Chloroflexi bacterium]|uniref:ATP/GTP-binding protein n=1 Tax=Candidatus Chlorohelix allophototropha TaxID=3003348 RepID=A0A8T7M2M9_9CHLR|nr:ATP/GTP-binding protein [Chloroflexota bacterium]WJW66611.1 ATP/GTP-binding protein [Chloroflexota bacterium L227-S17]
MQTVKMVITGAVAAGKTEFIKAISEIDVVSTERKATDETSLIKKETTVAMDFGRIAIADDLVLHLFGTPGQKRFDFMWEILSEGMLGLIVLIDSTRPDTFRETIRIIEFFTGYRKTPFIVACNKQDLENAWSPEDIRYSLRLSSDVKVIPCVSKDRDSVKKVLLELLYTILADAEED